MTTDDIIKKLRDMARYPTVTLPRDKEALSKAADLLAEQAIAQPSKQATYGAFNLEVVREWSGWQGTDAEVVANLKHMLAEAAEMGMPRLNTQQGEQA